MRHVIKTWFQVLGRERKARGTEQLRLLLQMTRGFTRLTEAQRLLQGGHPCLSWLAASGTTCHMLFEMPNAQVMHIQPGNKFWDKDDMFEKFQTTWGMAEIRPPLRPGEVNTVVPQRGPLLGTPGPQLLGCSSLWWELVRCLQVTCAHSPAHCKPSLDGLQPLMQWKCCRNCCRKRQIQGLLSETCWTIFFWIFLTHNWLNLQMGVPWIWRGDCTEILILFDKEKTL